MTDMTKMTQLFNGWEAPTELYEAVYRNTKAGVARMLPNKLYKAKLLAAEGYWDSLPNNKTKSLAGRCFYHLVRTKRFRLKFVQYKKSCTNHYKTL